MSVPDELAKRIAQRAFNEAMAFFKPSEEWEVLLRAKEEAAQWLQDGYPPNAWAACHISHQSLRVHVMYNPEKMTDGGELWLCIGHEVAHLLMTETIRLSDMLKEPHAENATHALEVTTIRLERLFARERPYPGDDAFAELEPAAVK